jgi:hypothetical protein
MARGSTWIEAVSKCSLNFDMRQKKFRAGALIVILASGTSTLRLDDQPA